MKLFLALSALAAVAWGSPIHGLNDGQNDQKGVYFVLPPAQPNPPHVTPEQVEELMNQLRQEDGSDSGVYHIVLPDGRLQRVEFTTAPVAEDRTSANLESSAADVSSAANLESSAPSAKLSGPAAILAQLGRTSVDASSKLTGPAPEEEKSVSGPAALVSQSPRPSKVTEESNLVPVSRLFLIAQPAVAEQKDESPRVDGDAAGVQSSRTAAKYVASVQYTEIQPITGPIYSYSPQPLTRIVRYAPVF